MKSRDVIRAIEDRGGMFVRQRGSHLRFRVEMNGVVAFTTVPNHEVGKGLLAKIERDLEPVLGKGWLR
jgi:predicted RNA binding protein YcfA (HicA-like mRNA interferase family)